MKIVWLSHSRELGGAERSLEEGVRGLIAQGHEVAVIVPMAGELSELLERAGAETVVIDSHWWMQLGRERHSLSRRLSWFKAQLGSSRRIRQFLQRARPDVFVTNTLTVATGALAARSLGIPHVWYIHEFGQEDHDLHFVLGRKLSSFFISRFSKIIIVNSQAVRSHFAKLLPARKLRVVYYAVDMPQEASSQKFALPDARQEADVETCQLILMGQIAPGKRQEDAIRAVALLKQKGLVVQLTIIGFERHPQYSALMRRLAEELGIGEQVSFIPFTTHPAAYLAAADVVLMCSMNEAFGRVTVEGMKMGKPVIGTSSGGTLDLIEDGSRGFLYPVGNVEVLAEKIELLCRDKELRTKMGEVAQEWSLQTFNTNRYADSLLHVFEEALS